MAKGVNCELCDLLHAPTAVECERCGHLIGTPVNERIIRDEMVGYKRQVLWGLTAIAAMLVLNWFLLQGAGGILLLAPVGWVLWGGAKWRHRSAYFRRKGA